MSDQAAQTEQVGWPQPAAPVVHHAWKRVASNSFGVPDAKHSAWKCSTCRQESMVGGRTKPGTWGCPGPAPAR